MEAMTDICAIGAYQALQDAMWFFTLIMALMIISGVSIGYSLKTTPQQEEE